MQRLSLFEHVGGALSAPCFLALSTPLPARFEREALILRDPPSNSILSFWIAQLNKLDQLIDEEAPTRAKWDALIPRDDRPAAGKLQLAALPQLSFLPG